MKQLLLKILTHRLIVNHLLNFFLRLHNWTYEIISILSIAVTGGTHPKHEILKYHEWFLSHVDNKSVVLDIGCNTGNLLFKLSDTIHRGYGIDIIEKMVLAANQNNKKKNIKFIHADATTYDFNQISDVNTITLSNVLEHIDDRVVFLNKIIRSLAGRPAKILIRIPLITRDWLSCFKKQRGVEYRLDQTHYTEYTENEIMTELTNAGIRINTSEVKFGEMYLECDVNSAPKR